MNRSPLMSSLRAQLFPLILAISVLLGGCTSSSGAGRVSGQPSPTRPTTGNVPFWEAHYPHSTAQEDCGNSGLLIGGGWTSEFSAPEVYGSWPSGASWMVTAASPADAPTHVQAECKDSSGDLSTTVYSAEIQLTPSSRGVSVNARCPNTDQTALSGGFSTEDDAGVGDSVPVDGQGWRVTFGGPLTGTAVGRAYVVCLNAKRDSRIVHGPSLTLDYFRIDTSVVQCPSGFEATGGGYELTNGEIQVMENAGGMDARGTWTVSAQRVDVIPATITASAYCVKW